MIWKKQFWNILRKNVILLFFFPIDDFDFYLLEFLKFSEACEASIILHCIFKKIIFRKNINGPHYSKNIIYRYEWHKQAIISIIAIKWNGPCVWCWGVLVGWGSYLMLVDTLHSHKIGLSPHHPLPVGTHLQYCPVKVTHYYSKEYYYILSFNKMSVILVNYPIHGYFNCSI